MTILTTFTLTNAIWRKRAAHDMKRAFCTIFMECAVFSLSGEILRPVWRFWELWRLKMRFGRNVLRMTWKQRLEKQSVFPFRREFRTSVTISRSLTLKKCDLAAKTCCSWPEKSNLYNFHKNRTVSPFWREFQVSVAILTTLTLQNAIWRKRAAHDLKQAFCTILMESAQFSRFKDNFRPVWRF